VTAFSFGRNWDDFVSDHFDEERVAVSQRRLLAFLALPSLAGRSFVDVGCGSGLHSLAAIRAGADRVVSFDVDPRSVAAAMRLRERAPTAAWEILEGSVLDAAFLERIAPGDVVYAWGSLHHTGAMWKAIENAAGLVRPGGLFYLALYTTTPKSPYWLEVKRRYNRSGPMRQRLMECRYFVRHTLLPDLVRLRSPFATVREYKRNRGMSYWTDVRDWLGGYPYEDARIEEVVRFGQRQLALRLVDIATGEANTEYLFHRPAGPGQ
jgi:2-polyprenyl-6-hydroxyphenyl methylase/3-demethylubiquinone-9 3-methyltransferase